MDRGLRRMVRSTSIRYRPELGRTIQKTDQAFQGQGQGQVQVQVQVQGQRMKKSRRWTGSRDDLLDLGHPYPPSAGPISIPPHLPVHATDHHPLKPRLKREDISWG
jgi:hypothetical protein